MYSYFRAFSHSSVHTKRRDTFHWNGWDAYKVSKRHIGCISLILRFYFHLHTPDRKAPLLPYICRLCSRSVCISLPLLWHCPQLKGLEVMAPDATLMEHFQPFLSQHRWDQHLLQGGPRKGGCLNVVWRAVDTLPNQPVACGDYSPASKGTTKSHRRLQVGPT